MRKLTSSNNQRCDNLIWMESNRPKRAENLTDSAKSRNHLTDALERVSCCRLLRTPLPKTATTAAAAAMIVKKHTHTKINEPRLRVFLSLLFLGPFCLTNNTRFLFYSALLNMISDCRFFLHLSRSNIQCLSVCLSTDLLSGAKSTNKKHSQNIGPCVSILHALLKETKWMSL